MRTYIKSAPIVHILRVRAHVLSYLLWQASHLSGRHLHRDALRQVPLDVLEVGVLGALRHAAEVEHPGGGIS